MARSARRDFPWLCFETTGCAGPSHINNCEGVPEAPVGINFGRHTNTVSGNTINGDATGIESVQAAFKGVNAFYGVPTINYEFGGAC